MTIRSNLLAAVADRRVVELRYQGDAAKRVIQPHIVYRTGTGKECVDGYQLAGPTHSGSLPDWRPFDLTKIQYLEVLHERFSPAPGYNPSSRKYQRGVVARV